MKHSFDQALEEFFQAEIEFAKEQQEKERAARRQDIALLKRVIDHPEEIVNSYNGEVGCMCGCKGTWSEKDSTNKRRAKKLLELAEQGYKIDSGTALSDEYYLIIDYGVDDSRRTAVYVQL